MAKPQCILTQNKPNGDGIFASCIRYSLTEDQLFSDSRQIRFKSQKI